MDSNLLGLLITGPAVVMGVLAFLSGNWFRENIGEGKSIVILFTGLLWLSTVLYGAICIGFGFYEGVK